MTAVAQSRPRWVLPLILALTACLHLLALVFIVRYTTTYPLAIDEWLHIVPRAVRLLEGETTFIDYVSAQRLDENLPAPAIYLYPWTFIGTNVALFGWNLQIDGLINYAFVVLNAGLVVYLLHREKHAVTLYLLIPVTALVLAVQQRWNLLVSIHQIHQVQITFFLLALLFIARPNRPRTSALLAFSMAFLGSFSMLHSWSVWVLLLPLLVILGNRDPVVYIAYVLGIVVNAVALSLVPGYTLFGNSNYFVGFEAASASVDVGGYILFVLAYLGGVFNYGPDGNLLFSLFMGVLGLALYPFNAVHLWRHAEYRRYVVLCTALMLYSGLFGSMASLARLDQYGVRWGLANHYMSAGALYWVGLSALITLSLWHMVTTQTQRRALILANLLAVVFGTVFYLNAVVGMFRVAEQHTVWVAAQEACIVRAAAGEDVGDGCEVVGGLATPDMIQNLYDYRLTGFANQP